MCKSQFWEREIKGSSLIEHDVLNTPFAYKILRSTSSHWRFRELFLPPAFELGASYAVLSSSQRTFQGFYQHLLVFTLRHPNPDAYFRRFSMSKALICLVAITSLGLAGCPSSNDEVQTPDSQQSQVETQNNLEGVEILGTSNADTAPTAIPTPVLLPGLIGMGVAAWRKRSHGQAETAPEQS
ncbi:MAG: PTPA-CTERM sorting domain-containing protein [Leptolyngbya sp. LCM1.Bin17]|nr:MAG: PTPA-CTERM sorting domain-containing protein [Leptolyngbya sp. LCM1.Bin17]